MCQNNFISHCCVNFIIFAETFLLIKHKHWNFFLVLQHLRIFHKWSIHFKNNILQIRLMVTKLLTKRCILKNWTKQRKPYWICNFKSELPDSHFTRIFTESRANQSVTKHPYLMTKMALCLSITFGNPSFLRAELSMLD